MKEETSNTGCVITTKKDGEYTVITPKGEDTPKAQKKIRNLIKQTAGSVILDLSQYVVVMSSFIGVLVISAHEKKNQGTKLILRNPTDRLLDLVHLTKTDKELEIIQ